jgi:hypothetical protein
VTERHPDPGVGHHPVVQVQVGATDRGERDPDDGVVKVLDDRVILLFDADAVGPR